MEPAATSELAERMVEGAGKTAAAEELPAGSIEATGAARGTERMVVGATVAPEAPEETGAANKVVAGMTEAAAN